MNAQYRPEKIGRSILISLCSAIYASSIPSQIVYLLQIANGLFRHRDVYSRLQLPTHGFHSHGQGLGKEPNYGKRLVPTDDDIMESICCDFVIGWLHLPHRGTGHLKTYGYKSVCKKLTLSCTATSRIPSHASVMSLCILFLYHSMAAPGVQPVLPLVLGTLGRTPGLLVKRRSFHDAQYVLDFRPSRNALCYVGQHCCMVFWSWKGADLLLHR